MPESFARGSRQSSSQRTLGHEPRATHRVGGRTRPSNKSEPSYNGKALITDRLGLRVIIQEPVEVSRSRKRDSKSATLESTDKTTNPQKETCSSDDDVIPEKLSRHAVDCSGHHADELYY